MITSTVIDPLAITSASASAERDVVNLLRGVVQNGIVLRDNNSILGRGFSDCSLAKQSAQVRELLLKAYLDFAFEVKIPPNTTAEKTVAMICNSHRPDLVVTERRPFPESLGSCTSKSHSLETFHTSEAENLRVLLSSALPPIDELGVSKFGEYMRRTTRFAKWLRIYDPYLAKGEGDSRFRTGLSFVLAQWRQDCCHEVAQCYLEIYTLDHDSDKGRSRLESAIREIQRDNPVMVHLRLVRDPDSIFHARHLETKEFIVQVDPGFDFFKADGQSLRRILLKPARSDKGHLASLRRLEKRFEKSYPATA